MAPIQVARVQRFFNQQPPKPGAIDKEIALELAWKDADAVYISFDVDSVDCGFVPGTGWPEPSKSSNTTAEISG